MIIVTKIVSSFCKSLSLGVETNCAIPFQATQCCCVWTINLCSKHRRILSLIALLPEPGFSLSAGRIYVSLFFWLKSSSDFMRFSSSHRMRRKRTTPILGYALLFFFPLHCDWFIASASLTDTIIDELLDLLVQLRFYLHDTNWWVWSSPCQK